MQKRTLNLIFGLKVRLLRQQAGLTLSQLSERTGTGVGYLHDIEKGKKLPSADKTLVLAEALGTTYDYLVSPQASKKLQPIVDLLESDFFRSYPLEMFGLEPAKIIELLSDEPEKVTTFVSVILSIARNYHLTQENLYLVALRAYQDMHDNYFEDLEQSAQAFRIQHGLDARLPVRTSDLERVLADHFGVRVDRTRMASIPALRVLRSCFSDTTRTLYLNAGLSSAQENFLLARELAFQHLKPAVRPYETILLHPDSFMVLLSNFRASYFASALLMDALRLAADVRLCAAGTRWAPEDWLALLGRYDATAEMLMQRLTNILPRQLGVKDLFFIRMQGDEALDDYVMTKELHLSGHQSPHSSERGEHYCRRWISINILRQLGSTGASDVVAGAQLSRYWQSPNTYLCISMAKMDGAGRRNGVSVTLGLLLNDTLRRHFRFVDDPLMPVKTVHTTCETCSIADCEARAAAPVEVEKEAERLAVLAGIRMLNEGV
ncbi:MAG: helix-turn-helix domain-containing protein [Saprospiraceae bacterium]|nr:helix-turn-helix domain-containing protein [Saprospiraceae bacterium]